MDKKGKTPQKRKENVRITSPFMPFHVKVPLFYSHVFTDRGKLALSGESTFEFYRRPPENDQIILVFYVCRSDKKRFFNVIKGLSRENDLALSVEKGIRL